MKLAVAVYCASMICLDPVLKVAGKWLSLMVLSNTRQHTSFSSVVFLAAVLGLDRMTRTLSNRKDTHVMNFADVQAVY